MVYILIFRIVFLARKKCYDEKKEGVNLSFGEMHGDDVRHTWLFHGDTVNIFGGLHRSSVVCDGDELYLFGELRQ